MNFYLEICPEDAPDLRLVGIVQLLALQDQSGILTRNVWRVEPEISSIVFLKKLAKPGIFLFIFDHYTWKIIAQIWL